MTALAGLHALGRNLCRDRRGAVMLIGLFMAVFLVASLYSIVGIGDAIAQRERMQDAADAAAFSGASLLARGMNTLALANMLMAALLAILVALKLVETLTAIAIVLIALLAFLEPGLANYIPGLSKLRSEVRAAHDQLEPTIHAAIATLHDLQRGIRVLAPAAAQLRAIELVHSEFRPPAEAGFLLPSARVALPTEDGDFGEVCERAAGYAGDLVALGLATVVPDAVADLVGEASADLAAAGGTWFCGDAGTTTPHTTLRVRQRLPILASRKACSAYSADDPAYSADEHAALCNQAEADEHAAEPDRQTGACVRECGEHGAYAERVALAREQCKPDPERRLRRFAWVQHQVDRSYEFRHGAWHVTRSHVVPGSTRRLVAEYAPCGDDRRAIGKQWTPRARTSDGAQPALCSGERLPEGDGFEGEHLGPSRFEQVVDVLGCVEQRRLTRRVAPDADGHPGSRRDETPQRLAAGAELGEEAFQVRGIALGRPPGAAAEALVALAQWGHDAPVAEAALARTARVAARASFAQAEYYYAVTRADADERAGFLWNMRWRARLRRFRLPEHARGTDRARGSISATDRDDAARFGATQPAGDAAAACRDAGGERANCERLGDVVTGAAELSIH